MAVVGASTTITGLFAQHVLRLRGVGGDEAGEFVPLDAKANDRILFGKRSGAEVKLDGAELLIMRESAIMGIIEGRPAAKRKAA
jgi:co-chaperonin GroES (HSP10)